MNEIKAKNLLDEIKYKRDDFFNYLIFEFEEISKIIKLNSFLNIEKDIEELRDYYNKYYELEKNLLSYLTILKIKSEMLKNKEIKFKNKDF